MFQLCYGENTSLFYEVMIILFCTRPNHWFYSKTHWSYMPLHARKCYP